jgi:DNA primase
MMRAGLVRRSASGQLYEAYAGRLIFPIWIESRQIAGFGGRLIPELCPDWLKNAPKYINSPESPVYQKHKIVFGLPQALPELRKSGTVYLVEGYMDVISLWQSGVVNAVAACGTALTESHLKKPARIASKAYVLFDGDQAGINAAAKSFPTFVGSEIDGWAIFLPEGEDPDSFALKKGGEMANWLTASEKSSLLDCHLNSLIQKSNSESAKDLGPTATGRIAQEVAKIIQRVEEPIKRDRLWQEAAFKLLLKPEQLAALGEAAPAAPVKEKAPPPPPPEVAKQPSSEAIKPIRALDKIDQAILMPIMALKEDLAERALGEPALVAGLNPVTLMFVHELVTIVKSDLGDAEKKESMKSLLGRFGESWKELWMTSYKMLRHSEADLRKSYEDCKRSIVDREKARLTVHKISELSATRDQGEQSRIGMEVLQIQKNLKQGQ